MGRRLCLAALFFFPGAAGAYDFVGPDNCRSCHPAAYDAWKDSKHAHASASLSPKQGRDKRCLSCHSPESARGVADVGCESCHSGGQYYYPAYVMRDAELARAAGLADPTQQTCERCHDASAPSVRPFAFAEKLKLIDHWTAERKAKAERAERAAKQPKSSETGADGEQAAGAVPSKRRGR